MVFRRNTLHTAGPERRAAACPHPAVSTRPAGTWMAWFIDTHGHDLPTTQARGLTQPELVALARIDPALARDFAAGICPDCGLNRNGTVHRDTCMQRRQHQQATSPTVTAIQPWMPRPSRRRAA